MSSTPPVEGLQPGAVVGRWTVLRAAQPARLGDEPCERRRWTVRCRCGHERVIFERDLARGDALVGCRSTHCRTQGLADLVVDLALAEHEEALRRAVGALGDEAAVDAALAAVRREHAAIRNRTRTIVFGPSRPARCDS